MRIVADSNWAIESGPGRRGTRCRTAPSAAGPTPTPASRFRRGGGQQGSGVEGREGRGAQSECSWVQPPPVREGGECFLHGHSERTQGGD